MDHNEEDDEEAGLEEEKDDDCDVDGDEMIIANTTDLIISITRALGSKYQSFYLKGTHEILINRLSDEYSHHDKNATPPPPTFLSSIRNTILL